MKLNEIKDITPNEDAKLALLESADAAPIEVADVIKNFPSQHKKALQKLWGGPRLVYHGMKFFDEIYDQIDDVLTKAMETVEVDISIPLDERFVHAINPKSQWLDFEYSCRVDDMQEVYMGYDPKSDSLYVGIDGWINEEDFNEEWDKQFKRTMREDFEHDEPAHNKLFADAYKKYQKLGFQGVLFKLNKRGRSFKASEVMSNDKGFYQGTYKSPDFKELGLVDLRLD